MMSCMACNADCSMSLSLMGPYCGDTMTNGPEVCDDGNTMTETACPYGMMTCTGCSAACDMSLSLMGPHCGDTTINGPEECDGTALGGEDCTTVPGGFTGGTLACSPTCMFDTSGCT
jgi:hypothetical protein